MSEDERIKFELDKLKRENEETAAQLLKEKVAFHTVIAISAKNLPDGFDEFLAAGTIEDTDARISKFEAKWQEAIRAAVDAKFKDNSDEPTRRPSTPAPKKWTEMTLTERGKLYDTDPEAAIKLAAASGIKL